MSDEIFNPPSKPTVEDTHKRATFLIRNDLIERLNEIVKGEKKGTKHRLVNKGIEKILDEYSEKQLSKDEESELIFRETIKKYNIDLSKEDEREKLDTLIKLSFNIR
ncbi:hypothetical protein VQL36_09515 [Chengkuizengella sp. SCS-71B]|uniref:hypothetical protein n=1 Tax=Chengkuizengella sp. SCS-71B TaxID=3115290 RepID=UPI0032C235B7